MCLNLLVQGESESIRDARAARAHTLSSATPPAAKRAAWCCTRGEGARGAHARRLIARFLCTKKKQKRAARTDGNRTGAQNSSRSPAENRPRGQNAAHPAHDLLKKMGELTTDGTCTHLGRARPLMAGSGGQVENLVSRSQVRRQTHDAHTMLLTVAPSPPFRVGENSLFIPRRGPPAECRRPRCVRR